MDSYFVSIPISAQKNICISEISASDLAEYGQTLGDDFGLFVYETSVDESSSRIEILGKLASYEAAERMADMLIKMYRKQRINRPSELSTLACASL